MAAITALPLDAGGAQDMATVLLLSSRFIHYLVFPAPRALFGSDSSAARVVVFRLRLFVAA